MIELNFSPFPVLETERLVLRVLQPCDANNIFALRSNDEINQYINRKKAETIDDALKFIERITQNIARNETLLWAIELKKDKSFAGSALLWNIKKEKNEIEVGYELLPAFQGKGIASEAIKAVIDFAFNALEAETIVAVVDKRNTASLKLLQHLNFVYSGKHEGEIGVDEYVLNSKNYIQ